MILLSNPLHHHHPPAQPHPWHKSIVVATTPHQLFQVPPLPTSPPLLHKSPIHVIPRSFRQVPHSLSIILLHRTNTTNTYSNTAPPTRFLHYYSSIHFLPLCPCITTHPSTLPFSPKAHQLNSRTLTLHLHKTPHRHPQPVQPFRVSLPKCNASTLPALFTPTSIQSAT